MSGMVKRILAAAAVCGFAAAFVGVGITLSTAQEKKVPDLSDLRDAVKVASKRGANVAEISKALDVLEKSLANGWSFPAPGKTVPPPAELMALRTALEDAARKGEDVENIRKELDLVEKAITGQTFTRPKPEAPPEPPPFQPNPNPFGRPGAFPQPFPLPNMRPGIVNPADMQKAQELLRKAMEQMLQNPNDADTKKLMQEAQAMMLKAMGGGRGFDLPVAPDLFFPDLGVDRVNRFRLGIRMERLTPIVIEQLGLERGQGVAIADVVPGSVAEKVGFKQHDIVLEFGGKPVSDEPGDLSRRVNEARVGEKVDAVVLRKGKKVEIKGIELPEVQQIPQRGIELRPLPVNPLNPLPALPDIQPRRPDAKPLPAPLPGVLPVNPVLPTFPNPLGRVPNGRLNAAAVTIANGVLTITATQDEVNYTITGTKNDEGVVIDKVTIGDGGKKPIEAAAVKDVPEEYRATVEKLIKNATAERAANRR